MDSASEENDRTRKTRKRQQVLQNLENQMKNSILLSRSRRRDAQSSSELRSSNNASYIDSTAYPLSKRLSTTFSSNRTNASSGSYTFDTVSGSANAIKSEIKNAPSALVDTGSELSNEPNVEPDVNNPQSIVEKSEFTEPETDGNANSDFWDKLSVSKILEYKFPNDMADISKSYKLSSNYSNIDTNTSDASPKSWESQTVKSALDGQTDTSETFPPWDIEMMMEYVSDDVAKSNRGTSSWVEMADRINLNSGGPVMDDRNFNDLSFDESANIRKNQTASSVGQTEHLRRSGAVLMEGSNSVVIYKAKLTHAFSTSFNIAKTTLRYVWLLLMGIWLIMRFVCATVRYGILFAIFTHNVAQKIYRAFQWTSECVQAGLNKINGARSYGNAELSKNESLVEMSTVINSSSDQPLHSGDKNEEKTNFLH